MKPEDFTCQWIMEDDPTSTYEQKSLEIVIDFFKSYKGESNLVMMDIGAHIGYWSIQMSPYFETIHAFECNPDLFPILSYNTYNHHNITLHPYGIDTKLEQKNFNYFTDYEFIGSYILDDEYFKEENKPVKNLNVTVAPPKVKGPVHFIKIDVEGAELNVLEACYKYKQYDPLLHIEIHHEKDKQIYTEKYITILHSIDESNHIARYK